MIQQTPQIETSDEATQAYHVQKNSSNSDNSKGTSSMFTTPQSNLSQANNHPHIASPMSYFAQPISVAEPQWYLDSGATSHITTTPQNLSLSSLYCGKKSFKLGVVNV